MDCDRRRHPRLPVTIEVELLREGRPSCLVRTEDLSNGGVLLVLETDDRPPLGERVQIRVVGTLGAGDTPPLVEARVVRYTEEGVAVQFIDGSVC